MSAERKLPVRRRRASKGQTIRVSKLVYETLSGQLRGRSWDNFMRRMLGLPNRKGDGQPLIEGMLEVTTGMFILKMPETKWAELEETAYKIAHKAAERKRSKRIEHPIRMRELP